MSELLSPAQIEDIARKAGKTASEVCRDAGIAPSTFSRWKRGETSPSVDNYERIVSAAKAAKPVAAQQVPA